ncbi:2658_t:CDS:2, partial [Racocetra persica]
RKIVSTHTERLHRQEEFTKTASSTNTSQEIEKSLLVTSQSFDILTSSAEDLTTSFLASNILLNPEQERQNIKQNTNLNYSSFEDSSSEDNKSEQLKNIFTIEDTGLFDKIELENSDIEEEIILDSRNIEASTQPTITALLIFIKALVFGNNSDFLETLYKAKDAISFKKTIIQFVVYEKCYFLTNLEIISNNSQQARCSECETLLKKPIKTSKGKLIYKPIKIYPYQSILSRLATLLQQSGFEEQLES